MDLSISQMLQMQQELYSLNKDHWPPLDHQYGRDFILYMVEEIGEVITIVKKKGSRAISEDPIVRNAFLEEMSDVLMYYHDILLRYHITAEELSEAYQNKYTRNIARNYKQEYEEQYNGKE